MSSHCRSAFHSGFEADFELQPDPASGCLLVSSSRPHPLSQGGLRAARAAAHPCGQTLASPRPEGDSRLHPVSRGSGFLSTVTGPLRLPAVLGHALKCTVHRWDTASLQLVSVPREPKYVSETHRPHGSGTELARRAWHQHAPHSGRPAAEPKAGSPRAPPASHLFGMTFRDSLFLC